MEPVTPLDDLEWYEVTIDWNEFRNLAPSEKSQFVKLIDRLRQNGWFADKGKPSKDWAFIDLDNYSYYEQYSKALKREGAAFYEATKAAKRGYYTKSFDEQTFIGDIVAINTSSAERQGRPMTAPYLRSVEDSGGYATEIRTPAVPKQSIFWTRNFGTFRALPGHRQGPLVVDEQLMSYMIVRRFGNFAFYGTIIGDYAHLRDGIVYKMHQDFIRNVLDAKQSAATGMPHDASLAGLRFVCYASYHDHEGLTRWKKSNLFRPGLFSVDIDPASNLK